MATAFQVDKLPLISEDSPSSLSDWEQIPSFQNRDQEASECNRYSLLEEDDDQEEMGAKGVADVDYSPEEDGCIELQKGELMCYILFGLQSHSLSYF